MTDASASSSSSVQERQEHAVAL